MLLSSEVFQHDLWLDPEMGRLCWALPLLPPGLFNLLFAPYGLTWLQCECGKILVKMWYVAAALAETLLEPPGVLFSTSRGDTLFMVGSLQSSHNALGKK